MDKQMKTLSFRKSEYEFFPPIYLQDRKDFNFKFLECQKKSLLCIFLMHRKLTSAKMVECPNPIIPKERNYSSLSGLPVSSVSSHAQNFLLSFEVTIGLIMNFLNFPGPVLPLELPVIASQFEILFLFSFTSWLIPTVSSQP